MKYRVRLEDLERGKVFTFDVDDKGNAHTVTMQCVTMEYCNHIPSDELFNKLGKSIVEYIKLDDEFIHPIAKALEDDTTDDTTDDISKGI